MEAGIIYKQPIISSPKKGFISICMTSICWENYENCFYNQSSIMISI